MGYPLKCPIASTAIADALGLPHSGPDVQVIQAAPLRSASAGSITFNNKDAAGVVGALTIATCTGRQSEALGSMLDSVSPRFDFIRALDYLEREIGFRVSETPAQIHPSVELGQGCVIEPDVVIGARTRIGHNAVIKRGTRIGRDCLIRSGAVVGDEGFGFERHPDGRPLRFVHLGGVVLGDRVEIGNATMVCRGTLGDTVIEDDVKIDNLVHIAHNCHLEPNVMIIACAEISGAVRIGKGAWVGPNACVIQKRSLGEGSLVGIGAVVLKDVEAKAVVVGNPAKPLQRNA